MQTILVPLDGSAQADSVLPYVASLARIQAARVCLLRVLADEYADTPVLQDSVKSYHVHEGTIVQEPAPLTLDIRRHQAEADHHAALIALRAAGLEAALEVAVGHPAEVIVERAAGKEMLLIAMATHGWSGLRRWALGSVTDKVIHAAPTPVFVVRSNAEPALPAPTFQRILVPIDQSALARKALPRATELAAATGAQILLLHVLTPPPMLGSPDPYMSADLSMLYANPDPELRAHALADLQELAEQLRLKDGVVVQCEVRAGFAAEEIIDAAEQRGIDLVVMATHGYSGLKRWALGSVADKVLHACRRPLLLVRAGDVSG